MGKTLAARLGFEEEIATEARTQSGALIAPDTVPVAKQSQDPTEASFQAADVEELCRTSVDFLGGLSLPTVFLYLFPPVFKTIWNWLLSYVHRTRDFSKLAIGLPRGFGKTLLMKVFILYCILFTKKQFILIICGTQTKANNIISDIASMLTEKNILAVFGDWRIGLENDRQDLKRFGFRGRSIILAGAGAGSDIRGITLNNERPDIMIFDDIQTREEADSEEVSGKLETWMIGTAMKAKSPHGCLFIFIANMYPTPHSLLRKLKKNPTWTKFIAGGILADGTSLWEELHPVHQLLDEYQNDLSMGRGEIFQAEVLNDEHASVNTRMDLSKVPVYDIPDSDIHQGNFIVIDPASGKKDGDAVSVGYFEVFDAKPAMKEVEEGTMSPLENITTAITLALRYNCRLIFIESNAYQSTLKFWFEYVCAQLRISGIIPVEIYSGKSSKNARILSMFQSLLKGELRYHPRTAAAVNSQITSFNAAKTDNTDGILDCLTYAPRIVAEHGAIIAGMTVVEDQESGNNEVWADHENSSW